MGSIFKSLCLSNAMGSMTSALSSALRSKNLLRFYFLAFPRKLRCLRKSGSLDQVWPCISRHHSHVIFMGQIFSKGKLGQWHTGEALLFLENSCWWMDDNTQILSGPEHIKSDSGRSHVGLPCLSPGFLRHKFSVSWECISFLGHQTCFCLSCK